MRVSLICYLLFFLLGACSATPFFQHDFGTAELFLSSSSTVQSQSFVHPFVITLDHKFDVAPTIVFSISGFEGLTDSQSTRIGVQIDEAAKDKFAMMIKREGLLNLVHVSYLVFDKVAVSSYGLLFWEKLQSTNKNSAQNMDGQSLQIIERERISQNLSGNKFVLSESSYTLQSSIKMGRLFEVVPFIKELLFFKGSSAFQISVNVEHSLSRVQVILDVVDSSLVSLKNLTYFLIFQVQVVDLIEGSGFPGWFKLSYLNMAFSGDQVKSTRQQSLSGSKLILVGLVSMKKWCSFQGNLTIGQYSHDLILKAKCLDGEASQSKKRLKVSQIWFNFDDSSQVGGEYEGKYGQSLLNHRLIQNQARLLPSTTCPAGQMYNIWNWTYLSTVTKQSLITFTTNTYTCMPCPVGCLTCSAVTNIGSMCWNAYCNSCATGYTMHFRTAYQTCTERAYCNCTNTNLFPNIANGLCQACSTVIPNCLACSAHEWAATFCLTCLTGFYRSPTGNDMARTCLPCVPGCGNCTNSTACATCLPTFTLSSGQCICNASKNLFYSAATNSCTSCIVAIVGCTSCTSTGLTVTCSACISGTFYNSGTNTCDYCTLYCSTCTATACTLCVSSTFSKSGTTCYCDPLLQMYLNTATTPASCSSCSTFIPSCVTCTGTAGSLSCSLCSPGYFYNGTYCQTCSPFCLNCTNSLSCGTCSATFISNGTSCVCDAMNGYILNVAGTACIACDLLIPNCLMCVLTPTVYCATCNDPFYDVGINSTVCALCPIECTSCTDALTCTGCVMGYTVLNGSCICLNCSTCALISSNCSVCDNATCFSCSPGLFLNASSLCQACPVGCSTCDNSTYCPACLSPFISSASQCVCNTAVGEYYDPVTQNCTSCGAIYPNCTACSGSGYITNCTACSVGTYLYNQTLCMPCPSNSTACTSANTSTACLPTFTLVGGQCVCDHIYQLFLDVNSNTCQSCSNLIAGCLTCTAVNFTTSGVACVDCADGLYEDNSSNCSACPSTCLTCSNLTYCIDCATSYSLINGSCVCDQSAQMFETGSLCAPCYAFIDYCTDCTGVGPLGVTCNSCVDGTYLDLTTNTTCISCAPNCASCNSSGCVNCSGGFSNIAGTCVYQDTCSTFLNMDINCADCLNVSETNSTTNVTTFTETCVACQAGFYLFSDTLCVACQSSCSTCSSYLTCLTCEPTFTLVSGSCQCNAYNSQVLSNGICVVCSALLTNCLACNSTANPVECLACIDTFYLSGTSCVPCPTGCLTCLSNGSCSSCLPGYNDPGNLTCINVAGCSTTQYFFGGICNPCNSTCLSCLDANTCFTCQATYSLINGVCQCDTNQGFFASVQNSICNLCGSFNSTLFGVYTQNCDTCAYDSANISVSFSCAACNSGFYLVNGRCSQCQQGCSKCTSNSSCYQCEQPAYIFSSGICVCDTSNNYFLNGTICEECNLTNCVVCLNLTDCKSCSTGYFINVTGQCQPQICGDGSTDGTEGCDDGNTLSGDGCSSLCQVQVHYICINPVGGGNSTCYLDDNRFKIQLNQQIYSCNKLQFKFELTGTQSFAACDFVGFLAYDNLSTPLQGYTVDGNYVIYTYLLNHTIQDVTVTFDFDPTTFCIADSYNFIAASITTKVNPTNNFPAIYYEGSICSQKDKIESLVDTIEYASYGTLLLSALPCKIVGLQLFGVLQLSFITLGSIDNVNLMLSPLKKMKGVNGLNLDIGKDEKKRLLQASSAFTPERINSIDYRANFIRNVNVMFLVVVSAIVVAFILFLITFFCKNCAPTLHRISKRLFKQVLLTLILFNVLNFSYSAGIHFKYAPKDDSLYMLGTLAAVATLIMPLLMAIALQCTQQQGFGEFKDKLKKGCIERAYFVVTIAYRMSIGLYLSTSNEDDLSTLIVLALSIMFLLYNLVNLPFTKAYHNYRANICHLTQFVTLFVTMYYRSMMSTSPIQSTAFIFSPAYFEYTCIMISLVVSLIVLTYEIYLFVKECFCKKQEQKQKVPDESKESHHEQIKQFNDTVQAIDIQEEKLVFDQNLNAQDAYDEYA